ncbi:hypothetical protein DFH07DRAFT_972465 [Mycena maculata]|uniref:Uncharacterized protein n=1 Tax=Mycena maculata TaxID=230809 RepID=A0AAD7MK46_9AGAR|nr:hypothetical protein DFH07DRAFT_972465 [Mycena maculata]
MLRKYVPHATATRFVYLHSREGFHPADVVDVPTWLSDRSDPRKSVAGWESVSHCSIKVIDIPGNHFEPFYSANIAQVSLSIAEGCAYLESL